MGSKPYFSALNNSRRVAERELRGTLLTIVLIRAEELPLCALNPAEEGFLNTCPLDPLLLQCWFGTHLARGMRGQVIM